MTIRFIASVSSAAIWLCAAQDTAIAQNMTLRGARVSAPTNTSLEIGNVRTTEAGSKEDVYRLTYRINPSDLTLSLTKKEKFPELGVYLDWLFARDVATVNPDYFVAGKRYSSSVTANHSSLPNGTMEISLSLEPGHVMYFYFGGSTESINVRFRGFGINYLGQISPSTYVLTNKFPILKRGTYKWTLESTTGKPFSVGFQPTNVNYTKQEVAYNGFQIDEYLPPYQRDYRKYRIALKKDDILQLPDVDSSVNVKLLGQYGEFVAWFRGLPLVYKAPYTGTYHAFLHNDSEYYASIYGKVSILRAPAQDVRGLGADVRPAAATSIPAISGPHTGRPMPRDR